MLLILLLIFLVGVFLFYIMKYGPKFFESPPKPYHWIEIQLESTFNINEWIHYAQKKKLRALERVLKDVQERIGGLSESKEEIKNELTNLQQTKYSNTLNKDQKSENTENSPTNLEVNRQNIVAAANFKNKLDVDSGHESSDDGGNESSDGGD